MTLTQTKSCTRCGSIKRLEDFPPNKQRSDGRQSICRECVNLRWRTRVIDPISKAVFDQRRRQRERDKYASDKEFRGKKIDSARTYRETSPVYKSNESARSKDRRKQPDYKAKELIRTGAQKKRKYANCEEYRDRRKAVERERYHTNRQYESFMRRMEEEEAEFLAANGDEE